jgi:FtsH-binding integral membrane protein
VPYNYFALLTFTFCTSVSIASSIQGYALNIIMTAVVLTLCLVLGLTVFAFVTNTDFTRAKFMGFAVFLSLVNMMLFFIFSSYKHDQVILGGISCITFGLYFIYDLQLLMDGKRRQMEVDDYVMASLTIY